MYGDFILLDNDDSTTTVERLAFGETAGRNEAWLRDTLLANPNLIPVGEIDPSFGPLIPLCSELGTGAGPIDAAFISPHGRLTLVECKLWRNPEARRKVVAQILDYARFLSKWSYSDFQRQVAIRTGTAGNTPYDLCRRHHDDLSEQRFVDSVARSLREGRFLLLIAGDGIREDVGAIADLINRNSAMGFSFGLVEVALYGLPTGSLLIQPRVVARTKIIERTVVLVRDASQALVDEGTDDAAEQTQAGSPGGSGVESERQAAYRRWWQPVLDAHLDDPEQTPPKLYWPNNIRAQLPMKGTWILCFNTGGTVGVCTAGRAGFYDEFIRAVADSRDAILSELPEGTEYRSFQSSNGMTFVVKRPIESFPSEDEAKAWLAATLNAFVNTFRPRLAAHPTIPEV